MIMHDWNSNQKNIMLLIHPMLSSANGMKEYIADHLGEEFRYLVPDLSAHGDVLKKTYKSATQEAEEIHAYLLAKDARRIKMAYGASLGGVVLLQLLKYDDLEFDHLFFEGTSFFTNAKFLYRIIRSVFLKEHAKAVKDPQLCKRRMAEIFGEDGASTLAEHFIGMNEESIENVAHDCAFVELPNLIEAIQKKCIFAYGDKDPDYRKARKMIPKTYPYARIEVWPGYGHCGRMSKDSVSYSEMLKRIAEDECVGITHFENPKQKDSGMLWNSEK